MRHGILGSSVWGASNSLKLFEIEPDLFEGSSQGRFHLYEAAVVRRDSGILRREAEAPVGLDRGVILTDRGNRTNFQVFRLP